MTTQSERANLLDALLEGMGEKGYCRAAVETALHQPGLDCGQCLVEFVDTDLSLFAAYDQLTERLRRKAGEGCAATHSEWPQRVCSGLQALLEEISANPQMARVLVRSFPSSGPEARARYQQFVEEFAPLLSEGREVSGVDDELPGEVEMLAVGAAEAIIFEEIEAGRAAGLPTLGPAILFSVLVPFLGPQAASAQMQTARGAIDRGDLEVA